LDNNQIVDLAPLRGLTGLYDLDLHGNQITDILPLVENPGLGWYDYVYLYDNPALANNPTQLEYVEQLRARGVTVDMTGPR
jgi:Leucine-rich repeat (LRR) protein